MKVIELIAANFGVPYVMLTSLYTPYFYYRQVMGYQRSVNWYPRSDTMFRDRVLSTRLLLPIE